MQRKQKYNWPEEIPDEKIKEEFAEVTEVTFSAKSFNYIQYRSIAFGNLGWWLPLVRVLPLISITPQMLRPVFNPSEVLRRKVEKTRVKRSSLLNLFEEVGLLEKKYENEVKCWVEEVELPEMIETYEELGSFRPSHEPFEKLARVLGKSVKVFMEDGGTGEHHLLFTAHPSGEIVKAQQV